MFAYHFYIVLPLSHVYDILIFCFIIELHYYCIGSKHSLFQIRKQLIILKILVIVYSIPSLILQYSNFGIPLQCMLS